MDIDFSSINNRNRVSPSSPSSSVAKGEGKTQGQSVEMDSMKKSVDFTLFKESLNELMALPEVRSEVVKVGRDLADDDTFPGDEALEKIAWALLSPEDNLSEFDNL